MTEQKPKHKGDEFAIGFLAGTFLVWLACYQFFQENILPALIIASVPIIAAILARSHKKRSISLGLFIAILISPLVFFGTCLANFDI